VRRRKKTIEKKDKRPLMFGFSGNNANKEQKRERERERKKMKQNDAFPSSHVTNNKLVIFSSIFPSLLSGTASCAGAKRTKKKPSEQRTNSNRVCVSPLYIYIYI
jgi:hypothetical protein